MDILSNRWYALKVFFNRCFQVEEYLKERGVESYIPITFEEKFVRGKRCILRKNAVSSLMFIKCDTAFLHEFCKEWEGKLFVYGDCATHKPLPISDKEMEIFILVTSKGMREIDYIEDARFDYKVGEHVRVTGGLFAGAEGYIHRIKGDKKLVVAIENVVMVATTYIPRCFLEKID